MYWRDYGMSQSEADEVVKHCRSASGVELREILDAANQANPAIAQFLFANLTVGVGYDTMSKSEYIPMQRKDFQAYRRKAIYIMFKGIEK